MNPRIRWVGLFLLLLFGLLFLQLNNIQVRQAHSLSQNFLASQHPIDLYTGEARGAILSADHKILAYSKPVGKQWLRVYPQATASEFAQITGSLDATIGLPEYGIESEYNNYLIQHESSVSSLKSLLGQHQQTDDVILTIPSKLQADAVSLVGSHPGSEIAAIDPQTGAVLAMYGPPSYNPNTISSLDYASAQSAFDALARQYPEPFLNIASAIPYAPGSTFKVMTTSALFDHDPQLASKQWPVYSTISLPDTTQTFSNYDHEACGGSLASILAVSCDTAYAMVGMDIGAQNLVSEAEKFGWCQGLGGVCKTGGSPPPLDLPADEVSGATMASASDLAAAPPLLAYSSIGQYNDRASALSMALVTAGIADNGIIMAPHLMSEIIDSDGQVVKRYRPHVWKRATSAATAIKVRSLMLGVAADPDGTAYGRFTNLLSSGIGVAAKTGTAEIIKGQCGTNDWMIAMAPAGNGQTPKAVVAVEIPTPTSSLNCSEGTGSLVAGPVADQMLTDILQAGL
jgi:peptidoglycan glycosyltransferase